MAESAAAALGPGTSMIVSTTSPSAGMPYIAINLQPTDPSIFFTTSARLAVGLAIMPMRRELVENFAIDGDEDAFAVDPSELGFAEIRVHRVARADAARVHQSRE